MARFVLIFLIISFWFGSNASPVFNSVYTDFSKDCKSDSRFSNGDIPLICKGPDDYTVYVSYSACFEYIKIQKKGNDLDISIPPQPIGASQKRKMEWRTLQGIPVGIIYRATEMEDDPSGSCPQKIKKEVLLIRIFATPSKELSIPSGSKANEKAREILESISKDIKK